MILFPEELPLPKSLNKALLAWAIQQGLLQGYKKYPLTCRTIIRMPTANNMRVILILVWLQESRWRIVCACTFAWRSTPLSAENRTLVSPWRRCCSRPSVPRPSWLTYHFLSQFLQISTLSVQLYFGMCNNQLKSHKMIQG